MASAITRSGTDSAASGRCCEVNTLTDLREALAHDAEQQRQRILQLSAGAELDALVHERIFDCRITCSAGINCADIPPYSTDAGAAMAVLDKWVEWEVRHHRDDTYTVTLKVGSVSCVVHAATWELAACRAALLATWKPR